MKVAFNSKSMCRKRFFLCARGHFLKSVNNMVVTSVKSWYNQSWTSSFYISFCQRIHQTLRMPSFINWKHRDQIVKFLFNSAMDALFIFADMKFCNNVMAFS